MTIGRPTILNDAKIAEANAYIDGGWKEAGDEVPTVAGMACEIGVARSTLYKWGDENEVFSDILTRVMEIQERGLLNNGLNGSFNPAVTKMILTKHGYADAVQQKTFSVTIDKEDADI